MAPLMRCHALPVLQESSKSQALWLPLHSVIATGPSIASMIAAALIAAAGLGEVTTWPDLAGIARVSGGKLES